MALPSARLSPRLEGGALTTRPRLLAADVLYKTGTKSVMSSSLSPRNTSMVLSFL